MLRFYFKNICSRPSCYQCHFKTINRVSDITIFDCWDAPSVSSEFSSKGATNVFIHTEHGASVFKEIKTDFICHPSEINAIITYALSGVQHKIITLSYNVCVLFRKIAFIP